MTAHNLLSPEQSRQKQAKRLRLHKLLHFGRPVTVLSVALLAATAVIGSTINATSYKDSLTAALPAPAIRHAAVQGSASAYFALSSSTSQDSAGEVLGTSVRAPAAPGGDPINAADVTSAVTSLVEHQLNQYLSQGLQTGPVGPQGPAGASTAAVSNNTGQITAVIGGNPIVTYVPSNPTNDFTGVSIAGFSELSAGSFASGNATINGNLNVSGPVSGSSLTTSGSVSVGGPLNHWSRPFLDNVRQSWRS
jgi:hypothetical protein